MLSLFIGVANLLIVWDLPLPIIGIFVGSFVGDTFMDLMGLVIGDYAIILFIINKR